MKKEFYIKTRNKFASMMEDNSIALFYAGVEICRSEDESFPFSVNRSFYYFTGINEENDILMIVKENGVAKSIIFVNEYSEYNAKWFGRKLFQEEALEMSGCDEAKNLPEFLDVLDSYIEKGFKVFADTTPCCFTEPFGQVKKLEFLLSKKNIKIENCHDLVVKCRISKYPEEIELIRKAISITNKGILKMMDEVKAGMYEYQVESFFDQTIKYNGASGFAFETIAAAGKNACVLHYRTNDSLINDGDLLLTDLGAEYELYKSDITRTYPVNGKFSKQQKLVYDIVLRGQDLVFKSIKPGLSPRDLNNILREYFCVELKKIGLIKEDSELDKYYFHGVSHHIGLDTHDIAARTDVLVPGSIISVEPGLYIPEWNIGIRIEDDALVTETGSENLSKEIIKTIDEIEAYMNK